MQRAAFSPLLTSQMKPPPPCLCDTVAAPGAFTWADFSFLFFFREDGNNF